MKPTAFKIACILGILLLALAVVLMFTNPRPENNLPSGFFTPIIAFEFIRTPTEVKHFFEVKNSMTYESSMLLGNWIDYGFMCLYSGLCLCIAIGIRKMTRVNALYFAMLLCLGMLLGDALENFEIRQIVLLYKTQDIQTHLDLLNIFTWIKWGSIASTFLIFSPFLFNGNLFHKFIGLLSVSSFGLCIAAYLVHGLLNELFALNVVLVFLLLVIFVFTYKEKRNSSYFA